MLADSPRRGTPTWRTADWGYVRFHEGVGRPRPCYTQAALADWADRLASIYDPTDEVFVYFNNDPRACALRDATIFARLMRRRGFEHGRVPRRSKIHLGDHRSAAWMPRGAGLTDRSP